MTISYSLDPRRSQFTVQVFASGALSAFAHSPVIAIRDFSGELACNPDTFEDAALTLTIKPDSMGVFDPNINAKDSADIERTMRAEVLETARFPEVRFHSSAITTTKISDNRFRLQISGPLSLHGVTGNLAFETQLLAMGGDVRLSGGFAILQSTYQIKRPSAAMGMIVAKDELKFSFDVVGQLPNA